MAIHQNIALSLFMSLFAQGCAQSDFITQGKGSAKNTPPSKANTSVQQNTGAAVATQPSTDLQNAGNTNGAAGAGNTGTAGAGGASPNPGALIDPVRRTEIMKANPCPLPNISSDFIEVSTQAGLQEMKPFVYYRLTSDIQLSGEFKPISNGPDADRKLNHFVLDGGGFELRGLQIKQPDVSNVGLYGVVNGVCVFNLKMLDVDVFGKNFVGAIVGLGQTAYIGPNVRVSGKVSGLSNVGGLAGMVSRAAQPQLPLPSFKQASFSGTVSSKFDLVGGLLGTSNQGIIIHESMAAAQVSGGTQVGGLVGNIFGSNASISNSYATGKASGVMNVGGLFGIAAANISNCYSNASVSASMAHAGGISPIELSSGYSMTASYWNSESNGSLTLDKAFGRSAAELANPATFSGWDFEKIWLAVPGAPPKLRWE